jgi:ribosomal protein S18 acetylase RimI-like enzyme
MRRAPLEKFRIRAATMADVAAIALVHVASWNDHYRGILDNAEIDRRTLNVRIGHWTQTLAAPGQRSYVAVSDDGATTFGFASALVLPNAPDGFDAYLGQLYLRSEATGHGIGRELLRALAQDLIEHDCANLALRVLRANPARAFYERLGARLVPAGISNDAGLFDDVVYAFDDLSSLV